MSSDFAKQILKGIHQTDLEARGDWLVEYGGVEYTVKVKKVGNQVEYQVKNGRKIMARYHLVMTEV
jgi:hypothetical protein